jgi:hypothetical protein
VAAAIESLIIEEWGGEGQRIGVLAAPLVLGLKTSKK